MLTAVSFDGTSDYLLSGAIPAIESSEISWFVVYQKASMQSQGLIGGNYSSNPKQWQSYSNSNNNYVVNCHYATGSITYNRYLDNGSSFNFTENIASTSNFSTYRNGSFIGTKNVGYSAPTGHNSVSLGKLPASSTSYFFNGYIAEAFVFNYAVNSLERVLIENYIGAKYNLAIPTDLYSYEGTHFLNVIGIGNNGTNSHTDSKGNGYVEILNPTDLGSNEYLLVGHSNVPITSTSNADMPVAVSSHHRYDRTWRVDETGEVGDLTLIFDVSGIASFAYPNTYNLLVDSDGNFSDATVVAGTYNSANQTMSFTVNLNAGDFFTLSGLLLLPTAIHSVQTGNWSDVNTWDCGCVPSLSDTVFVQNTDIVSVDVDAYTHHLTVESSATLNMAQDNLLSVYGDFVVDGSATLTDGTIQFIGSNIQNISANGNTLELNNIIINNFIQTDVNFDNGEFVLNNTLYPTKGNMNVNSPATFIINSTSANTSGRVDVVSPNFNLVGNVSVRRFLPAGVSGERDISSPVVGATLAHWDADIEISGEGFPDGCAYDSTCYYSVKQFELGAYVDITDINHTLESGEGYEVFIGTDLNNFNGATITSTGTLRDFTDLTLNVKRGGWTILGNPYASPILFSSIDHHFDIGDYFYVYDAAAGSYQWYDDASASSSTAELTNGLLAIGQGFWVYNNNPNADKYFTYKQSDKVSSTATFIRRETLVDNSIYLTLKQEGTTFKNTMSVGFVENAYDDFDTLDIIHLATVKQKASSIMVKTQESLLAKNFVQDDRRDKSMMVSVKINSEGYFSIDASNLENNFMYKFITLYDNVTGDVIDLRKYPSYTFFSEAGEFDRFELVLSNERIEGNSTSTNIIGEEGTISISQIGNAVNIQSEDQIEGNSSLTIYNLLGQELIFSTNFEVQKGDNIIFVPEELSGMYVVVVTTSKGREAKKMMF